MDVAERRLERWLAVHGSVSDEDGSEAHGLVRKAYREILRREPDPNGLRDWARAIAEGMTYRDLCAALAASPEGQLLGLEVARNDPEPTVSAFADLHGLVAAGEIDADVPALATIAAAFRVCRGRLPDVDEVSAALAALGASFDASKAVRWVSRSDFGRIRRRLIGRLRKRRVVSQAMQLEQEAGFLLLSSQLRAAEERLEGVVDSLGGLSLVFGELSSEMELRLAQLEVNLKSSAP